MDDIIDEIEEIETPTVEKGAFAAIPIHFRPGPDKIKRVMLVIPNVEPPLKFFEISGEDKDSITIEEVSGPSETGEDTDIEPEGEVLETEEASVEADEADEPTPEDSEDTPEEETFEDEPVDEEFEDSPAEEEDPELEGEIDYPYEDEQGNPIAGFLIDDSEDAPLPVVVVKPQEGESVEEAMERVSKDHEGHRAATLDQAIALLGHNPLTSEDN